jgi:hypothetical protein
MDQIKVPEIKPEVNREEERKGGGFFLSLLSKLGGGLGSGGLEGLGAGAGQAGLVGGLLATKAGIIALALIGASVAGGLGVVGYKAFGPGSEQAGGYSSLFESRPQAGGSSASSVDGNSQSLDLLVKANSNEAGPQEGGAAPAEAPAQDAGAGAAGSSSGETAQVPADVAGAANNDNAPFQGATAAFKSDKKIGELSKISLSGAGSGSSAASAGPAGPAPGALLASAKGAGLSAFPSGASSRAVARSARGIRRMGSSASALKQLGLVKGDQKGAITSAQAGRTYDGPSNAIGGVDGGFGGLAGQGSSGGGDTAPSQNPVFGSSERFPAPPAEKGVDVTPWKAAIDTAALLVVAATALLFLAGKLAKTQIPHARALSAVMAGLAAFMGAAVVALGIMIGGGAYGQTLQGGILTAAGGFLIGASALAMTGMGEGKVTFGMPTDKVVMIAGAGALAAAAAAFMITPKSFPAATFQDGRPPDWDHRYQKASNPNG